MKVNAVIFINSMFTYLLTVQWVDQLAGLFFAFLAGVVGMCGKWFVEWIRKEEIVKMLWLKLKDKIGK